MQTGEILWQNYRGVQIRHAYFSEDDSVIYIDSQECIAAFNASDGEMIWQTFTANGFCIDMIMSSKYLYCSPKGVGGNDNKLACIDRKTGEPLWTLNYGGQAAWFTGDSQYVAIKDYGILEVFTRDGNKIATTACGSNSKMSWFVYMKDDLSRILNIAGGGGGGNSGWLYNMVLEEGYDRAFIDKQLEK